jgi:hypothetical protein
MPEPRILEIMGHKVNLDRIWNPTLRRVIRKRIRYDEFMFSGHQQYNENTYKDWKEYKEHKQYNEKPYSNYGDKYRDDYHDYYFFAGNI